MTFEGDTENAKTFKKRIFLENRRQGLLKGTPILKKFNRRFFWISARAIYTYSCYLVTTL